VSSSIAPLTVRYVTNTPNASHRAHFTRYIIRQCLHHIRPSGQNVSFGKPTLKFMTRCSDWTECERIYNAYEALNVCGEWNMAILWLEFVLCVLGFPD